MCVFINAYSECGCLLVNYGDKEMCIMIENEKYRFSRNLWLRITIFNK